MTQHLCRLAESASFDLSSRISQDVVQNATSAGMLHILDVPSTSKTMISLPGQEKMQAMLSCVCFRMIANILSILPSSETPLPLRISLSSLGALGQGDFAPSVRASLFPDCSSSLDMPGYSGALVPPARSHSFQFKGLLRIGHSPLIHVRGVVGRAQLV